MAKTFDSIVIGVGQAGPYLARRLAGSGLTVAVVERKLFGGTCVNTGCIPTKAMVASAYAAHLARRGGDYGVGIGSNVRVDLARVAARRDAIVEQSRSGLEKSLKNLDRCTVFEGHARLESAHEVSVGAERLTAERIFVNVGARARVPDLRGVKDVPFLTNSSIMTLAELPRHLVIVGGGYVGLEFGQMFRRFGSEVTVIEMRPRLLSNEDEDVCGSIHGILAAEGIGIRVNAECVHLSTRGADIAVGVDCREGEPEVIGSHVLLAVGRQPNTADLGLEKAGVSVDDRGYIIVDDELRTNVPGIWAVGECNGKGAFTHTAYNDGEIVAANLLDKDRRRVSDRIATYALFVDPPLGRAGKTEAEVRATGRPALVGRRPMTKVARAVEKGETQGFMKVIVDAESSEILGAAILGTGGDETIHAILDVMYARAPYTTISRAMHIHPTVSELVPTMLGELEPLK
jgi:pyruvate/2-oxoglutarate dehydrogenase complex dihydrolipoamide dehydrogenase (E3) component